MTWDPYYTHCLSLIQALMSPSQLVDFNRLDMACSALPTADLLTALGKCVHSIVQHIAAALPGLAFLNLATNQSRLASICAALYVMRLQRAIRMLRATLLTCPAAPHSNGMCKLTARRLN